MNIGQAKSLKIVNMAKSERQIKDKIRQIHGMKFENSMPKVIRCQNLFNKTFTNFNVLLLNI